MESSLKRAMIEKLDNDLARLFEQQQRGNRKSCRRYAELVKKIRELRDEPASCRTRPASQGGNDLCTDYIF